MNPSQILEGIKVTDFSWLIAGPLTTRYLADFGADVVRIESLDHADALRSSPPFVDGVPGLDRSGAYYNLNSGKKNITLNMQQPQAREIARRLVLGSDVVVENFTSRVMQQWGLDYERVRATHPGVIYVSLSMEGRTGPHRDNRGYGTVLQAMVGVAHLTGWPDRGPTLPGTAYTDMVIPPLAAFGVLTALEHRRRTGEGQWLDISQMEAMLYTMGAPIVDALTRGRDAGRLGNRARGQALAPHGVYPCAEQDSWIAIVIHDDADWTRLVSLLEVDGAQWAGRADWQTVEGRIAEQDELDRRIGEWTAGHEAQALMRRLQASGIDAGVVQNQREVTEDPQLQWRGHAQRLDHPEIGIQAYDGHSFRLDGAAARLERTALLGEHTRDVMRERLGYSEAEIDALYESGAFS